MTIYFQTQTIVPFNEVDRNRYFGGKYVLESRNPTIYWQRQNLWGIGEN